MRRECDELRSRLASAEAKRGDLQQGVGAVSEEIGETIAELDSLLEK